VRVQHVEDGGGGGLVSHAGEIAEGNEREVVTGYQKLLSLALSLFISPPFPFTMCPTLLCSRMTFDLSLHLPLSCINTFR